MKTRTCKYAAAETNYEWTYPSPAKSETRFPKAAAGNLKKHTMNRQNKAGRGHSITSREKH